MWCVRNTVNWYLCMREERFGREKDKIKEKISYRYRERERGRERGLEREERKKNPIEATKLTIRCMEKTSWNPLHHFMAPWLFVVQSRQMGQVE